MLKTVVLLNIFVETMIIFFFMIHRWIESSKVQHLFEIFCNIINVFTVTSHQFNASLMNTSINFSQKYTYIWLSAAAATQCFSVSLSSCGAADYRLSAVVIFHNCFSVQSWYQTVCLSSGCINIDEGNLSQLHCCQLKSIITRHNLTWNTEIRRRV